MPARSSSALKVRDASPPRAAVCDAGVMDPCVAQAGWTCPMPIRTAPKMSAASQLLISRLFMLILRGVWPFPFRHDSRFRGPSEVNDKVHELGVSQALPNHGLLHLGE